MDSCLDAVQGWPRPRDPGSNPEEICSLKYMQQLLLVTFLNLTKFWDNLARQGSEAFSITEHRVLGEDMTLEIS